MPRHATILEQASFKKTATAIDGDTMKMESSARRSIRTNYQLWELSNFVTSEIRFASNASRLLVAVNSIHPHSSVNLHGKAFFRAEG